MEQNMLLYSQKIHFVALSWLLLKQYIFPRKMQGQSPKKGPSLAGNKDNKEQLSSW
jgi:hypothetical protein